MSNVTKWEKPLHEGMPEWPEPTSDLRWVPDSVEVLRLMAGAKGFDRLETLKNLKRLWCFNLNRKSLDSVSKALSLDALYIDTVRGTDLSALVRLKQLTTLSVDSCSQEHTVDWVRLLPALTAFKIGNLKALNDLSAVGALSTLSALMVSGGMWSKMTVRSLRPIVSLTELRFLGLLSLRIEDELLEPLLSLGGLVELSLTGNLASWEQYARLAAALPSTKCEWFRPYVEFPVSTCKKCGRPELVIMTGKRQPMLCKACDARKVRKLVDRFEKIRLS